MQEFVLAYSYGKCVYTAATQLALQAETYQ